MNKEVKAEDFTIKELSRIETMSYPALIITRCGSRQLINAAGFPMTWYMPLTSNLKASHLISESITADREDYKRSFDRRGVAHFWGKTVAIYKEA